MQQLTVQDEQDILDDLKRMDEIIDSGIFEEETIRKEISNNTLNPLRQSAFIEVMIAVHDLLKKCTKIGISVVFFDDIYVTDDVKNVNHLIGRIRNACCHIDSGNRFTSNGGRVVATVLPIHEVGARSNGEEIPGNIYKDDMAFIYGNQRIYLKRHIIRAKDVAISFLKDKLSHYSLP